VAERGNCCFSGGTWGVSSSSSGDGNGGGDEANGMRALGGATAAYQQWLGSDEGDAEVDPRGGLLDSFLSSRLRPETGVCVPVPLRAKGGGRWREPWPNAGPYGAT
jgi:hypothetical protein